MGIEPTPPTPQPAPDNGFEDLSPGLSHFAAAPSPGRPGRRITITVGLPGRPDFLQARSTIRWRLEGSFGPHFEPGGQTWKRQVEQALRTLVEYPP